MTRTGYLGLGSNLGERRAHLEAAVAELRQSGVEVTAASSTYDTEPVGEVLDQAQFLNACLRVRTALEPEELLGVCKAAERAVGREAGGQLQGPRVIDVDVLLLGDLVHASDRMRIPHAELSARRFVLVPLLELDPALELPDGIKLADALGRLGEGQAVRLAGPPLA